MLRPPRIREAAFSLIELLVGMVLMVIVLAGVVSAIMNLTGGNDDLTADRAAQRQAIDAMEQLRSDAAAVRSPGFAQWDGRRETMREVVAFDKVPTQSGTLVPARIACQGASGGFLGCLRDVTYASGSQVWMRGDVRTSTPGAECVGYAVTGGALVRYVSSSWGSCGPGVDGSVQTQLIVAKSLPASPFTYTLRFNPKMVPNQEAQPDDCQTWSGTAALEMLDKPVARNWITSIDIDLTGITTQRNGAGTAGLRSSMPITSHTAGDYAFAVGCSY